MSAAGCGVKPMRPGCLLAIAAMVGGSAGVPIAVWHSGWHGALAPISQNAFAKAANASSYSHA